MRGTRGTTAVLLAAALALSACGEAGDEPVRLIEGQRSQPERSEGASLAFLTPSRGATVTDTTVATRLSLNGFALGEPTPGAEDRGLALSDRGQHLHLIVDDRPYQAVYDLSRPVRVGGLEPGFHLMRAFPSRQWHESVKAENAFATTWFFVPGEEAEADTARAAFDPEAPLLTYSRPKGAYEGSDADSVMVDFYLSHVTIGPGPDEHRVRLTVDDTLSWDLTRWVPHYLLGLPTGEHTVQLELVAPDSTVVEGPFPPVERTIYVRRGRQGG